MTLVSRGSIATAGSFCRPRACEHSISVASVYAAPVPSVYALTDLGRLEAVVLCWNCDLDDKFSSQSAHLFFGTAHLERPPVVTHSLGVVAQQ